MGLKKEDLYEVGLDLLYWRVIWGLVVGVVGALTVGIVLLIAIAL